jgi:microcystin degradation protein MlrC
MTFDHETCTFCPGGDSDLERWARIREPYVGDEVLSAGPYVRGFVAAAGEYRDVQLIGLQSPARVFGGSSASWSTEDAFNHFMDLMLEDLREAMPVDGVYLALHGAMAVRNIPRPEAEIAKRFREVVGPDIPIVASFDLHGNEDEEFLRWANTAFVTKRYPHYDAGIQGARSARSLVRMARGGSGFTTNNTAFRADDLLVRGGASYRQVIDVGNWDAATMTNAPGQSGDPRSPFYGNLLKGWAADGAFPLLFSREKVLAHKALTIHLSPK